MQTSDQPADNAQHLRTKATLVGTVAVLLWSSLAPLTAMAHSIPPLELLAMTFGIAFLCGLTWLFVTGGLSSVQRLKQPLSYLGFATAALFGYHALYFAALSLAPPAQASLIAYLWPLLTVLFSAWSSRDDRVRASHIVGAFLGFTGTALLVLSGDADHTALPYRSLGLLAALLCAVIWSSYSVLNRHFRNVPSEAMIGICGWVALLGWGVHFLVDSQTVLPGISQWFAIVALGVGPIGLAFLAWDYGTKHGHVSVLGTVSYAAPVLSTLLLVVLGYTPASLSLLAASALVVGGAWTATTSSRRLQR
jgi:drug/metabolite transporter (DMT)-like permease